jgi:hypothetical protein
MMSGIANYHAALELAASNATLRRDRRVALFVALSLLVHGLFVWQMREELGSMVLGVDAPTPGAPLIARVAPPRIVVPETPAPAPSAAPAPSPSPAPSPRLPSRPSILARPAPPPPLLDAPSSTFRLPVEPPVAPPEPAAPSDRPIAQNYPDLSSLVAARRRARGEPAEGYPSAGTGSARIDDENARRERVIAQNLAAINAPTVGGSRNTGGVFQITHLGYDDAEFTFYGWHQEVKRRASQRIDVRRGSDGDIKLAVVRRMIEIMRRYEQEDFTWSSQRLGRDVTLSARAQDQAGLEAFLIREFF